jgi:hypothetical protein
MFPVRFELNLYILFSINSVFKGLINFQIFSVFTIIQNKITDITFRQLFREYRILCDTPLEYNVANWFISF